MRAPHPLLPLRGPGYPLATVAMSYPLPGGPEPLTPRPSPLLLYFFPLLFCLLTLSRRVWIKALVPQSHGPAPGLTCPSSHHTGAI